MAMPVSTRKRLSKGISQMTDAVPRMNRMLKILLPTMLPMAMSAFPLRAATTEVTSSGSDVPNATMVRPMNR